MKKNIFSSNSKIFSIKFKHMKPNNRNMRKLFLINSIIIKIEPGRTINDTIKKLNDYLDLNH